MSDKPSTLKTVSEHRHPSSSTKPHRTFIRHPASSSAHASPTHHVVPKPHTSSHPKPKPTGAATQPHQSLTPAAAPSSSTTDVYPTPSTPPSHSSGAIIGLSITLALVLVGLLVAGALFYMRRRAAKKRAEVRQSVMGGFVEMAEHEQAPPVISAPEPVRPGRESEASLGRRVTRFFQGRRVPSGWI
ncbi:uncharacterized protein LTR77_005266 [Saxophila tyrrhenica]|uniref:Uncharacterized protein n=1 Tax=Saxophila tyrrhenica TaxID=1690608 RepID=A0AAV9PBH1_9PEZI|nr:hypothetical protein LTR77_005266 [Saxophila tyrrhenica]